MHLNPCSVRINHYEGSEMSNNYELDIQTVIDFFGIDREKAIDMIAKGFNASVIRNGNPLLQQEIGEITKKYTNVMADLLGKLQKATDDVKADLNSAQNSK